MEISHFRFSFKTYTPRTFYSPLSLHSKKRISMSPSLFSEERSGQEWLKRVLVSTSLSLLFHNLKRSESLLLVQEQRKNREGREKEERREEKVRQQWTVTSGWMDIHEPRNLSHKLSLPSSPTAPNRENIYWTKEYISNERKNIYRAIWRVTKYAKIYVLIRSGGEKKCFSKLNWIWKPFPLIMFVWKLG